MSTRCSNSLTSFVNYCENIMFQGSGLKQRGTSDGCSAKTRATSMPRPMPDSDANSSCHMVPNGVPCHMLNLGAPAEGKQETCCVSKPASSNQNQSARKNVLRSVLMPCEIWLNETCPVERPKNRNPTATPIAANISASCPFGTPA